MAKQNDLGDHIKKTSETTAVRFLLKDIALQAGVGTATVDRVLNDRGGVRWQTVERVRNAIAELENQSSQLALRGTKLIVDLVVEAAGSFCDALDEALRSELPLLQPAAFRVRKDMRTNFPLQDLEQVLARAVARGSHGIILMAPDTDAIRRAVDNAVQKGVPVVTLATDLPGSARQAYVGLDNARAGETAAWFFWRIWQRTPAPRLLLTLRNDRFRGEEARAASFKASMQRMLPQAQVETLVEGRDTTEFLRKVTQAAQIQPFDGLYSVGGKNAMLLAALDNRADPRPAVVAHDLEAQNKELLRLGKIDLLIYHDLSEDIRNACRVIMSVQSKGRMPLPPNGASLRLATPTIAG